MAADIDDHHSRRHFQEHHASLKRHFQGKTTDSHTERVKTKGIRYIHWWDLGDILNYENYLWWDLGDIQLELSFSLVSHEPTMLINLWADIDRNHPTSLKIWFAACIAYVYAALFRQSVHVSMSTLTSSRQARKQPFQFIKSHPPCLLHACIDLGKKEMKQPQEHKRTSQCKTCILMK